MIHDSCRPVVLSSCRPVVLSSCSGDNGTSHLLTHFHHHHHQGAPFVGTSGRRWTKTLLAAPCQNLGFALPFSFSFSFSVFLSSPQNSKNDATAKRHRSASPRIRPVEMNDQTEEKLVLIKLPGIYRRLKSGGMPESESGSPTPTGRRCGAACPHSSTMAALSTASNGNAAAWSRRRGWVIGKSSGRGRCRKLPSFVLPPMACGVI